MGRSAGDSDHWLPPAISSISFAAVDGSLLAALHIAQLQAAVGLKDDQAPSTDSIGMLELALQAAPGEVELGGETRVAQLPCQGDRPPPICIDSHRNKGVPSIRRLHLVQGKQDALDPGGPADRRRRRPPS